jgi:hypothetical protein
MEIETTLLLGRFNPLFKRVHAVLPALPPANLAVSLQNLAAAWNWPHIFWQAE